MLRAANRRLRGSGLSVATMLDNFAHVAVAGQRIRADDALLDVWLDVDMSLRPIGALHLGVRRSPLHSANQVAALASRVLQEPSLRLRGIMGYEAQVAGLGDFSGTGPLSVLESCLRTVIKRWSCRDGEARRAASARLCEGLVGDDTRLLCNGGGSGSLAISACDTRVTEVTVGSGLLCGHLFDEYFDSSAPLYRPALFFALTATRVPADGIVTCHGGGWVASGQAGSSRLPKPVWPAGSALLTMEGAGEVQTPVCVGDAVVLQGSPVIFRPAKSGELGSSLPSYVLVTPGSTTDDPPRTQSVKTYAGEGLNPWASPMP